MKKITTGGGRGYLAVSAKKYKKLRVDDFFKGINGRLDQSVMSPSAAAESFNFDFSSGALCDGVGIEDIGITGLTVANIWRFVKNTADAGEIIMFSGAGGDVFYIKNGIHALGIVLNGRVSVFNCRLHGAEAVLMWGEDGRVAVWDGENSAYFADSCVNIKSADVCGQLAFVAQSDGQTIRYFDGIDPIGWDATLAEGFLSSVEGSGSIGRLVSFLGYLFVFKDYSISRISINGEPKAAGSHVFGGRIFFDTIALCGGKIIFLSGDGLYEFDGLTAKRILGFLTGIIPSPSACATYRGGKYYLAARCEFKGGRTGCETGEYTNNALITYSPSDGGYTLSRGMDITCLAAGDEEVFAVCGGAAARLTAGASVFGTPLLKLWKSPLTDLGSEKTKTLKEVYIETSGAITLSVFNERESKSVDLSGSDRPQRVRIAIRGEKLGFCIESRECGSRIARPVMVYSERGV